MNRAMKRTKGKGKVESVLYDDTLEQMLNYFKRFSENLISREDDFMTFELNGARVNVREELLVSLAFMPDELKRGMQNKLLADEKILDCAIDNMANIFKQYSECHVKMKRLSFTHSKINTFDSVALASILLGRHRKASAIILSYAIMSVEMTACSYKMKEDTLIDGAYMECLGYWLKAKGLMEDRTKDGMLMKMTLKELVIYMNERIVPEKFVENMDYYKRGVGKAYARYKMGEIEFEDYVKEVSTTSGKYEISDKLAYLTSLEEFTDQFLESTDVKVKEVFPEKEQWEVLHKIAYVTTMEEKMAKFHTEFLKLYAYKTEKIQKEMEKLKNNQEEVESSRERFKEKESKYRKMLRDKDDEIVGLRKRNDEMVRKLEKAEELKKVGVKDVRPYVAEIEKLKKEVETRKERMKLMDRDNQKLQSELSRGVEAYNKLEGTINELSNKIREMENRDRLMIENEGLSDIPLNILIEPIKNKRIAIVGGDSLHYNLKELGFKNMKLLKAGETFPQNALNNVELIVYMTGELAHRVYHQADSLARSKKIKTYRFNNRNINMLCKEIFACCYS